MCSGFVTRHRAKTEMDDVDVGSCKASVFKVSRLSGLNQKEKLIIVSNE